MVGNERDVQLTSAFHTLPITILLYASTRLGYAANEIILLCILPSAVMALGNMVLPRIQKAAGWSNRTVMVLAISIAITIPLWGSLGLYIPFAGLRTKKSVNLLNVVAFVRPALDRADARHTVRSSATPGQSLPR